MIEAAIVALIKAGDAKAIVGSRVYPIIAPEDVQRSADAFIVYERISGSPAHTTQGPSGLAWARIEVRAWAKTYLVAKQLAKVIRNGDGTPGIDGHSGVVAIASGSVDVNSILSSDDRDLYDDELKLFGVSVDYLAWYHDK